MRQMMGVFAQLEKAMAVKRMRAGQRAKAAAGRHAVGVYPFGSRAGGEGKDRDAVPDDDELRAVARILELHQAGQSYRQVITTIEAEGIMPRTAAHWSPSTIRKIVLRTDLATCRNCGKPIVRNGPSGPWIHQDGFPGSRGCRAASLVSGAGWDESLDRRDMAEPR